MQLGFNLPISGPNAEPRNFARIGFNKRHLLDTLPRLTAGIARLRRLTAEASRDPAEVGVAYRMKKLR